MACSQHLSHIVSALSLKDEAGNERKVWNFIIYTAQSTAGHAGEMNVSDQTLSSMEMNSFFGKILLCQITRCDDGVTY